MFRNQLKRIPFNPENGMRITGMGRLSLYNPGEAIKYFLSTWHPKVAGAFACKI